MESEFKPSFDDKKWQAFMKDTPTMFKGPFGGKINFRKELVKNILIDLRDLWYFDFDVFQGSQGDEGSGKTHFMSQLAYVYHWFMQELGMIEYDWSLDLLYGSLDKMNRDFIKYRFDPYRIYILDEGDELSGENFYKPNHRQFRSEMRRGRKFKRLVFVNMPQIKELTSRLVTTRMQRIYEIEVDRDFSNFDIERGELKVFGIPRGRTAFSSYHDDFLNKNYIKNKMSELMKAREDFVQFTNDILLFQANYNGTHVFDKRAYNKKIADETSDIFKASFSEGLTLAEVKMLNKVFFWMSENRKYSEVFEGNEALLKCCYRLRDKLNKVDEDMWTRHND